MSTRVIIADDSDLTILGATTIIESDHRYVIAATARAIDELLTMAVKESPDVILLNEWFHGMDILSAVEKLKEAAPRAKLIACGVNGYLYKSDDLQDCLIMALDTVMRDRPFLSPTANAEYLVTLHARQPEGYLDDEAREVLNQLAKGIHAGQIAREMGITQRRVYWVRQKLRQRFGAKTNEHLIHRAAAEGFTCLQE
ncbi:MAG: response regulator transcription factor [Anaerolineae bacterium]|nr:response regulator transcription factor [Anaerolineae bacterium]